MRKLNNNTCAHCSISTNVLSGFATKEALVDHLSEQAESLGLEWLLLHADDGVCWGRYEKDEMQLRLSIDAEVDAGNGIYSAPLNPKTLQEARLFGEKGEYYLWREAPGLWRARTIREADDQQITWDTSFDEPYWLWGRYAEVLDDTFTLLHEGRQGLRHVAPIAIKNQLVNEEEGSLNGVKLIVRHYLPLFDSNNDNADAYIEASRLVTLDHTES